MRASQHKTRVHEAHLLPRGHFALRQPRQRSLVFCFVIIHSKYTNLRFKALTRRRFEKDILKLIPGAPRAWSYIWSELELSVSVCLAKGLFDASVAKGVCLAGGGTPPRRLDGRELQQRVYYNNIVSHILISLPLAQLQRHSH